MDKQNLMPNQAQPVNRTTTGQLPSELAELSEEALQIQGDDTCGASVQPQWQGGGGYFQIGNIPLLGSLAKAICLNSISNGTGGLIPGTDDSIAPRFCSYDGDDVE